jgi:hypothetical protein
MTFGKKQPTNSGGDFETGGVGNEEGKGGEPEGATGSEPNPVVCGAEETTFGYWSKQLNPNVRITSNPTCGVLFVTSEATLKETGLKIPFYPLLKLKIKHAEIRPTVSIGNNPASFNVTDEFQRILSKLLTEAYMNGSPVINFNVDLAEYDGESGYTGVYKNAAVKMTSW